MSTRTLKLVLSKPVLFAGRELTEIVLREPVAGDMRRWSVGGAQTVAELLDMVAELAGVPADLINELPPTDAIAAIDLVTPFFVRSPTTGPTL